MLYKLVVFNLDLWRVDVYSDFDFGSWNGFFSTLLARSAKTLQSRVDLGACMPFNCFLAELFKQHCSLNGNIFLASLMKFHKGFRFSRVLIG